MQARLNTNLTSHYYGKNVNAFGAISNPRCLLYSKKKVLPCFGLTFYLAMNNLDRYYSMTAKESLTS